MLRSSSIVLFALLSSQVVVAQVRGAPPSTPAAAMLERAAASDTKSALLRHLDAHLLLALEERRRDATERRPPAVRSRTTGIVQSPDGAILIDVVADGPVEALRARLHGLGMRGIASHGRIVSGWLPGAALESLPGVAGLRFARAALYRRAAGTVQTQGDVAHGADQLRAASGATGAGAVVGVLSDSYDCLGGATADIASGNLPANVVVLRDAADAGGCNGVRDEGRAMLQIVHDIAPSASLAFHTALGGTAAFANGILRLRSESAARVIVDDLLYLTEPMFQDGPIAQAVDSVAAQGALYFSAAGNNGRQSYVAPFRTSGRRGYLPRSDRHDFDAGAGVDDLLDVAIGAGQTVNVVLQWSDPFFSVSGAPGASIDIDLLLYTATGTPVAGSIIDNVGGDAVELLSYANPGAAATFRIGIEHRNGPLPATIKLVWFGALTPQEHATLSSTIYGHPNAAGARATGAAYFASTPNFGVVPPQPETFTSTGGTPILFDTVGQPVLAQRPKPELVGADGVDNTVFGTDTDGNGRPNFFGTSAAAPHVGGVAALLLEIAPDATRTRILAALQDTAVDMAAPGVDELTGAGLVDAPAAAAQLTASAGAGFAAFTTDGSGALLGQTVPTNAYAAHGLTFEASGATGGSAQTAASVGTTTGSATRFNGRSLAATGAAGATRVTLRFAPEVNDVSFAFASNSGSARISVLEQSGSIRRSFELQAAQTVRFSDLTLIGGAASVDEPVPFAGLRIETLGTDTRLRVDAIRWSTRSGATVAEGEAPWPAWAIGLLGILLYQIGSRNLAKRSATA